MKIKSKDKVFNGPVLTHYIKTLQGMYKDSFNAGTTHTKELLLHCLQLLELNDISSQNQIKDYSVYTKEKLVSELYQRVIRNVI